MRCYIGLTLFAGTNESDVQRKSIFWCPWIVLGRLQSADLGENARGKRPGSRSSSFNTESMPVSRVLFDFLEVLWGQGTLRTFHKRRKLITCMNSSTLMDMVTNRWAVILFTFLALYSDIFLVARCKSIIRICTFVHGHVCIWVINTTLRYFWWQRS